MIKLKVKSSLGLFILLCLPGAALANAGVPMIFFVMPVLGLSIVPIIILETIYLRSSLALDLSVAAKTTTIANLFSTLVGVPLTWLLLVLIQMLSGGGGAYGLESMFGKILAVTLQAAWLIPYEKDLVWIIPMAGLFLLIPFFLVSWWTEYMVAKKILAEHPAHQIKLKVRNANIITYALLAFWPIGYWLVNNMSTTG